MPINSETIKEIDESNEIANIKKIEAALFLSARFLSLKELVLLTDVNPLMLKELMEKLMYQYNTRDSAIEIIKKEEMWKMDVRQEFTPMVNKLATGSSEFSKAEQETLAVIAYKQPVKQSVIIKIRGNKAYDHIKNFISVGLVIAKKVGHTNELKLSEDFFDYFHLQNSGRILDDHPDSENNKESGDLQKKEDGSVIGIEKNGDEIDENSEVEVDEESEEIENDEEKIN